MRVIASWNAQAIIGRTSFRTIRISPSINDKMMRFLSNPIGFASFEFRFHKILNSNLLTELWVWRVRHRFHCSNLVRRTYCPNWVDAFHEGLRTSPPHQGHSLRCDQMHLSALKPEIPAIVWWMDFSASAFFWRAISKVCLFLAYPIQGCQPIFEYSDTLFLCFELFTKISPRSVKDRFRRRASLTRTSSPFWENTIARILPFLSTVQIFLILRFKFILIPNRCSNLNLRLFEFMLHILQELIQNFFWILNAIEQVVNVRFEYSLDFLKDRYWWSFPYDFQRFRPYIYPTYLHLNPPIRF